MGKGKKVPKVAPRGAKEKHASRQQQPATLGVRPAPKLKYKEYCTFIPNKGYKKKKLRFDVYTSKSPPRGFVFVPISSANLTKACKEISQEKEAMVYIVSESTADKSFELSHQLHRIGHHVRHDVWQEATAMTAHKPDAYFTGQPEPIPDSQEEYTRQASAAILELFPNIPNTDRQAVLTRSFNLSNRGSSSMRIGLNASLPLHRRVQGAVLAHIRHTHTRYDELIREEGWHFAREHAEPVCVKFLVKWRGNEENGDDQLDELARWVVVIPDSDSEEFEDDEEDEYDPEDLFRNGEEDAEELEEGEYSPEDLSGNGEDSDASMSDEHVPQQNSAAPAVAGVPGLTLAGPSDTYSDQDARDHRSNARKKQSGFKRYQQAWDDALKSGSGDPYHLNSSRPETVSHGAQHASHEAVPPLGAASPVPEPNGYADRRPSFGAVAHFLPANWTKQQVESEPSGQPQHPMGTPRPVSPPEGVLQDLLVQSIEPASPHNVNTPQFVRSLPPRTLPPTVRRPLNYRPAPNEEDVQDRPFYVLNNRPAGSIAERMRETPQTHGRSPVPAQRFGHSPAFRNDPHYPPATYRAPTPTPQTGNRDRSVRMEDRGGFYERVYKQPAQAQPRVPDRVVSWEEGSRYIHEAQNDGDVEIISVSRPQQWPAAPGGPRIDGPAWELSFLHEPPNQYGENRGQERGRQSPGHQPRQEPIHPPDPYYGQAVPPQQYGQPAYHQQPPPMPFGGHAQFPPCPPVFPPPMPQDPPHPPAYRPPFPPPFPPPDYNPLASNNGSGGRRVMNYQ